MSKTALPTLARLLYGFFHEWLVEQRNVSQSTVVAYRDAWRLFLRFIAKRQQRQVAALRLEHLTEPEVLAFLQHIERERRDCIITRNCRLAVNPQLLFLRRRTRTAGGQTVRGGPARAFQANNSAGHLLPGARRSVCNPVPT